MSSWANKCHPKDVFDFIWKAFAWKRDWSGSHTEYCVAADWKGTQWKKQILSVPLAVTEATLQ